jgi:hypothetical protein
MLIFMFVVAPTLTSLPTRSRLIFVSVVAVATTSTLDLGYPKRPLLP